MEKDLIITSIKKEKPFLQREFGVEEIGLFGSYARGEETPESDVDILVKFKIKTLHNYISLIEYLQEKIHKKIDMVSKHQHLSPRFLKLVNKDIIYV